MITKNLNDDHSFSFAHLNWPGSKKFPFSVRIGQRGLGIIAATNINYMKHPRLHCGASEEFNNKPDSAKRMGIQREIHLSERLR